MKLIVHKLGTGEKYDRLRCVRDDETSCEVSLPRQGILPHDLIHAAIESRLGFNDGFIGLVAKGSDIDFAGKEFHRYIDPSHGHQLAHAESLVESLQAQLWSGKFDDAAFREGLATACAMRGVPLPDLSAINPHKDLFDVVKHLGRVWESVPPNSDWELQFPLELEMA